MAADSAAPPAAAPSAHSILAADGTASYGFMMFGGPVWPKPSMPQAAPVDGSTCIGPSAPAGEGPSLVPSALSIWPIAASTVQDRPGQYFAAESWNSCRYVVGSWSELTFVTGSCCWRRLTILPDAPSTALTSVISLVRPTPGALISAATRCTRPSSADSLLSTSRSTPSMPSEAAPPNRTSWVLAPVSR